MSKIITFKKIIHHMLWLGILLLIMPISMHAQTQANNLSVTYTKASENIVVKFDLMGSSVNEELIPDLDATNPNDVASIAAKYGALKLALDSGISTDIETAALALGDDIITEYYYLNGSTEVFLKTAGGNNLIKNKYWEKYLINTASSTGYPNFGTSLFLVPAGSYITSTNPATSTVATGWLNAVYGKDLHVRVTVVSNGQVNVAKKTAFIAPVGPVDLYSDHFVTFVSSHATIQSAVNAAVAGNYIKVASGTYAENITVNKDLTIQGPNAGIAGNGVRVAEAIIADGKINIAGTNTVVFDGFKIYQTNTITPISLGGTSTATIQNNIIERFGSATGSTIRGIETSPGIGVKTIANNLFTGDTSGGLYSGHKTWNSGMYVNGGSSTVAISNNVFENCRAALNIDDMNSGITLNGNSFSASGTLISFGGTSPTAGSFTFGPNDYIPSGGTFMNLSNVAPSFRLDISAGTTGGTSFSSLSLANLFLVESTMFHRTRSSKNGLVYYVANTQFVLSATNNNIQTAIDYAASGDVITVQDGSYNQRLTVGKSIKLDGQSETGTILNGAGLTGTGSGITINTGVTNVTIQDLTVQNFAGNGPNSFAGIYAIGGNNTLTVQNTTIKDNLGGSGIYANGPIDNVLLNNLDISGHSAIIGAARGIVIWNGLKSNITITNSDIYNNNCCGIELQDGSATGVNISNNNVTNNGDNGLGLTGLMGPGENVVSNNIVTNNGRFGIEIKNPNGSGTESGAASIVVENNTVSISSITDARDIAGIAVFRRGVIASNNNVDVPNGVIVQNNAVSGYTQPSTSEGFGIVIEGTNHTITGNIVGSNDIGIQQQAGYTPYPGDGDQTNKVDSYFGRGNSPSTCGNTVSGNTLSSNTLDERNVGVGSGLVTNATTSVIYCSIQSAIDSAAVGNVIEVPAGTYNEQVLVNKAVTIKGVGVTKPIINFTGTPGLAGGGLTAFKVTSADVTIENFEFKVDISKLGSAILATGATLNLT